MLDSFLSLEWLSERKWVIYLCFSYKCQFCGGGNRRSDLGCERSRLHLVKQLWHRRIYRTWKCPLPFCGKEATWKMLCVYSVFIFRMFWLKKARYFNFLLLLHRAQSSTVKCLQFALVRLLSCFSCACVYAATVTVWTSIIYSFPGLCSLLVLWLSSGDSFWHTEEILIFIILFPWKCSTACRFQLNCILCRVSEISVVFLSARQCVMFSLSVTELVFSCAEKTFINIPRTREHTGFGEI